MKHQVRRSTGASASNDREENYTTECVPPSARLTMQTRACCSSATLTVDGRTDSRPDCSDSQAAGNAGGETAALNIFPETIRFPCNTSGVPKGPLGDDVSLVLQL